MKASAAVAKLEKAGFEVITNGNYFSAKRNDSIVEFVSSNGNVRSNGFSESSKSSCSPTYGLKLHQVI